MTNPQEMERMLDSLLALEQHIIMKSKINKSDQNAQTVLETDWKTIAWKLARQCEFALGSLKADGWTGILLDTSGDNITQRHWKEEMADVMELIPGLKVNREAMHQPRKKRKP